jgi:hypothetical protein
MSAAVTEEISIIEHRPASSILHMLEDLYRRQPETRWRTSFELMCLLWSLGYADGLLPEEEIAGAAAVLRALETQPSRAV